VKDRYREARIFFEKSELAHLEQLAEAFERFAARVFVGRRMRGVLTSGWLIGKEGGAERAWSWNLEYGAKSLLHERLLFLSVFNRFLISETSSDSKAALISRLSRW
jgi:hypothetical protein